MITRSQMLEIFDITLSVLSDIRRILSLVPNYKVLLHHVSMFRDFLEREYEKDS